MTRSFNELIKSISNASPLYGECLSRLYKENVPVSPAERPPSILIFGFFGNELARKIVAEKDFDCQNILCCMENYIDGDDEYTDLVVTTGFVEGIVDSLYSYEEILDRLIQVMPPKMKRYAQLWREGD